MINKINTLNFLKTRQQIYPKKVYLYDENLLKIELNFFNFRNLAYEEPISDSIQAISF